MTLNESRLTYTDAERRLAMHLCTSYSPRGLWPTDDDGQAVWLDEARAALTIAFNAAEQPKDAAPRLLLAIDAIERIAANDACGCPEMGAIIAECQMAQQDMTAAAQPYYPEQSEEAPCVIDPAVPDDFPDRKDCLRAGRHVCGAKVPEQAFRVVYRVVHPDRGMLRGLWTTGVYAKREDAERVVSEAGYNGAYIIEEKVQ